MKIIGILNLNNESFYDGGKYNTIDLAYRRAIEMRQQGADIIEIGGFSTKPGSSLPKIDEELNRIIPSLELINKIGVEISIETCRSEIVKEVIKYKNVKYINDTSGLKDESIIKYITNTDIKYILLHMPTTYEKTNNHDPIYDSNIIKEIDDFFKTKIATMHSKGFDQIIIDPGFFYNKSAIHNLQVIKHLSYFKKFGYPIFIGLSRKSLILGPQFSKSTKSLIESYILTFECLKNGAEYVRVHDIEEMKHIQKIFNLYKLVQG